MNVAAQIIVQDDCLAHLRTLPPSSVKAFVFSPPYNLGKSYRSYDDGRPLAEYLAEQEAVAVQVARVLDREEGHLFLNVGWNSKHPLRAVEVMLEYAKHLVLQNSIVWVKSIALDGSTLPKHLRNEMDRRTVGHFVSLNSDYFLNPTAEMIWHFSPTGRSRIDRREIGVPYVWADQPARFGHYRDVHCPGLCWHMPYPTTQSRADRDYHPSPFPVELPLRCLKLAGGKPGDLVIDPFMGTGATLLAAKQLNLDAIGIEIDPGYCAAARRRLGQNGANADAAK